MSLIETVTTDLGAADYCKAWMELFRHLKSNGLDVMVTMSYFAGDFTAVSADADVADVDEVDVADADEEDADVAGADEADAVWPQRVA